MLALKNNKENMKRKAFTLVELMVTLAIMGLVIVLIGGLANFTAGRLESAQIKTANEALRSSLDAIGQKMYSANEYKKIDGQDVYGFRSEGDVLTIVSSGSIDNAVTCTYFGKRDDQLMMAQNTICSAMTIDELTNPVTPSRIFVTEFSVNSINQMDDLGATEIPKVKITLKGYDKSDPLGPAAQSTVETTFTMDGENVKWLKETYVSAP